MVFLTGQYAATSIKVSSATLLLQTLKHFLCEEKTWAEGISTAIQFTSLIRCVASMVSPGGVVDSMMSPGGVVDSMASPGGE